MYSGMADVAAMTGDQAYIHALDTFWENVVDKKTYVTGGIGALGEGEAFGAITSTPFIRFGFHSAGFCPFPSVIFAVLLSKQRHDHRPRTTTLTVSALQTDSPEASARRASIQGEEQNRRHSAF